MTQRSTHAEHNQKSRNRADMHVVQADVCIHLFARAVESVQLGLYNTKDGYNLAGRFFGKDVDLPKFLHVGSLDTRST